MRRVLDAFRRIVRALRVSARRAEKSVGISGAQLFVLRTLAGAGYAMSVNALAGATATHQSSVSVVAQRLAKRGLVVRRRSARDGRGVELRITAAGRALLRHSPEVAQDGLIGAIRRLSLDERARLAALLEQVARDAGMVAGPAELFFEPRSGRYAADHAGKRFQKGKDKRDGSS
jgi:DNA-binding MarR family transcriptional regulator